MTRPKTPLVWPCSGICLVKVKFTNRDKGILTSAQARLIITNTRNWLVLRRNFYSSEIPGNRRSKANFEDHLYFWQKKIAMSSSSGSDSSVNVPGRLNLSK